MKEVIFMKNLFENIKIEEKEDILRSLEAISLYFKKDENIYKKINKYNQIVLIDKGYLRLYKTDYDGKRSLVGEYDESNPFNTMILSFSNNDYEMIAQEETKITIIDYATIKHFKGKNLPFYYTTFFINFIDLFTEITNLLNQRIDIITKTTIREKILQYFKILSRKQGTKNIYLPFSITELADYLASNRSAVSRELKVLKDEKLILMKNRKITLLLENQ